MASLPNSLRLFEYSVSPILLRRRVRRRSFRTNVKAQPQISRERLKVPVVAAFFHLFWIDEGEEEGINFNDFIDWVKIVIGRRGMLRDL